MWRKGCRGLRRPGRLTSGPLGYARELGFHSQSREEGCLRSRLASNKFGLAPGVGAGMVGMCVLVCACACMCVCV